MVVMMMTITSLVKDGHLSVSVLFFDDLYHIRNITLMSDSQGLSLISPGSCIVYRLSLRTP